MTHKPTTLMVYSRNAIKNFVPNVNGVYYLRGIADENSLYPIYYIGRAEKGRLREELLDKFYTNEWLDITYINYIECDSKKEAKQLQKFEILRHKPKYNLQKEEIHAFVESPALHFTR
ncbi:hypothetical protein JW766_02995 [Candidatus Dojkabacteria bacterium]|nr:hypothetical protein [Candidatus Dojkabacteria bacterium]